MQTSVLSACASGRHCRADCRIDWVRRSPRYRSQLPCIEQSSKTRNSMRPLRRRYRPRTKDTDHRASHRRSQALPAKRPILPAWPSRRFQSALRASITEHVERIVSDNSSSERSGGACARQNRVNCASRLRVFVSRTGTSRKTCSDFPFRRHATGRDR